MCTFLAKISVFAETASLMLCLMSNAELRCLFSPSYFWPLFKKKSRMQVIHVQKSSGHGESPNIFWISWPEIMVFGLYNTPPSRSYDELLLAVGTAHPGLQPDLSVLIFSLGSSWLADWTLLIPGSHSSFSANPAVWVEGSSWIILNGKIKRKTDESQISDTDVML